MISMLLSLFLVFAGIAAGYIAQRRMNVAARAGNFSIPKIRKLIQKWILSVLIPITAVGSIWIAPLRHVEILALPFLGAFTILLGGAAALLAARPLGLNREQAGVLAVAGGFTNMGSLGGLIVFILLGEAGFALLAFYQLFEKFLYFMVGFPLAKSRSRYGGEKSSVKAQFLEAARDPIITINMGALILGTVLNLTGVPRPGFFLYVNRILVPLGSVGLLFSIGLAMKFGAMGKYRPAGIAISGIKSLLLPAVTFFLGYILGLGRIADGLVLQFLLILSAMPVGFMAMVPPTLYDMDLDLANTCWLFSNAALLLVVPVLSLLIPLIG